MTEARGTILSETTEITIPGHTVTPWVWTGRVIPDGWARVEDIGVATTPSGLSEFDFYMDRAEDPSEVYGVNLRVTGRTVQGGYGSATGPRIRCQIEFVGDGEPSVFHGGWLRVR